MQKVREVGEEITWIESIPVYGLRRGGISTHAVVISCVKDEQGITAPVSHQLHPRSCLLDVEPELTDGRGDLEHPGIGQVLDNADYETCVGPAEASCVVCVLASTHLGYVFVQLVLGHVHRSQMHDTDNRWIRGEHYIASKVGEPRYPGTGRVMVADLIKVDGSVAVGVRTFYGYQCPVCVGVFVLCASVEGDSDVNVRTRSSNARMLRAHIHWVKGVGKMRGIEEELDAPMTHGTGGQNRRLRGCDAW